MELSAGEFTARRCAPRMSILAPQLIRRAVRPRKDHRTCVLRQRLTDGRRRGKVVHLGGGVGKVSCFAIAGLELWFNSNDHLPHHFHVSRVGEWEIRVYFLEVTEDTLSYDVKWGPIPSRRVRDSIRNLVVQHRESLLLEWEEKVCQE